MKIFKQARRYGSKLAMVGTGLVVSVGNALAADPVTLSEALGIDISAQEPKLWAAIAITIGIAATLMIFRRVKGTMR